MPIEFAPPQANLQGLNIQPPQYSDPLQTLAEMGQLRSQAIQRQGAEMALQQNQRKMQSQEGLMKAWQESGGDLEKMVTLAPQYGGIGAAGNTALMAGFGGAGGWNLSNIGKNLGGMWGGGWGSGRGSAFTPQGYTPGGAYDKNPWGG